MAALKEVCDMLDTYGGRDKVSEPKLNAVKHARMQHIGFQCQHSKHRVASSTHFHFYVERTYIV